MRVLMIGPYPEPGKHVTGGVERVIDTLLPELAKHIDLTLIAPQASRNGESSNYDIRTVYFKKPPGPGALSYWTVDAYRTARLVAQLQPDLVHFQGPVGIGKLIRSPSIFTVHGIVDRDLIASNRDKRYGLIARKIAAQIVRNAEARARRIISNVIVINPYVIEALPDVANLRQFEIPNPIDPIFCTPLPPQSQKRARRIISVGRIGPRKNTLHAVAIAACALKTDKHSSFIVFGPPNNAKYLRECEMIAQADGIEQRIVFPGSITSERLKIELQQSSILMMTSKQETAPMAIAEAHARGVAVVAPEAFGIKHMITPGRNGFFLPDADISTQADVLRQALDHDWDRDAIAAEAQAAYNPEHVAELTVAAYRDVLSKK